MVESSDPIAGDPYRSSPPPPTITISEELGELPLSSPSPLPRLEYNPLNTGTYIQTEPSSDPLMATLQNFSAPTLRLPNKETRKRGHSPTDLSEQPSKEPRLGNIQQPQSLSKELVLQARDLLIKACSLSNSR